MSNNKVALVTGGSRGLGKDMAISLAKKGVGVVLTFNSNQPEAEEVRQIIQSLGQKAAILKLDVSDVSGVNEFVSGLKETLQSEFNTEKIDFLINNGGAGASDKPVAETTEEQFDQLMNVYLKGVFFFTQKMIPVMNDGGSIVNISSGLTRVFSPGRAAYAMMKSGIETFTKYLAKELGNRSIRANVIAPGAIATDFGGGHTKNNPQVQNYLKSIAAIPRIGQPDDIGGVAAFLCSDEARWITGQRIEASGGMSL